VVIARDLLPQRITPAPLHAVDARESRHA
jgi:hypothetical protein